MAGKNEAAASPNANATTSATNPGGLIPAMPDITTATMIAIRADQSSFFSDIFGLSQFLSKSWEMEVEITNISPAAVDKAAARPPATTSPIIQPGRLAISGLANTIIS